MRLTIAVMICLGAPMAAHASTETSVVNATLMCRWLDSLDFLTGKCAVSTKSSAVDVRIQTSKSEAKSICATLAQTMRSDGVDFDKGWNLRIFDPKKPSSRLAQCGL